VTDSHGSRAAVIVERSATEEAVADGSPAAWRTALDAVRQIVLVAAAVLLYFGVRGRTEGERTVAVRHGRDIIRLEARVGIDLERGLQSLIVGHHWLITLANWTYIFGHWPVIVGTLIWLFRRHHREYLLLRNALFISGAIGLVIFMTYPVAPPRLLNAGYEDTVTAFSTAYRALQPPALINKYAAMPSLHVGWNLLVGLAIWRTARRRWVRYLGLAGPVLMATAVLATANHYVLDVIVGSLVALIGLAGSLWLTPRLIAPGGRTRIGPGRSAGRDRTFDGHQVAASASDPGADRADRAVEHLGRLLVAQVQHLGQHERLPPIAVEAVQQLLGVTASRREIAGDGGSDPVDEPPLPLTPADVIGADPPTDHQHPGLDRRLAAIRVE
jgi:membrane-associated phospholipid phosphatase